jgi:hypothetical protein
MNCTTAQEHWELYHDSEGESQLYLEVNDHLSRCAACREWFERQQSFEASLLARLRGDSRSDDMWTRLEGQLCKTTSATSRNWSSLLRYVAVAASIVLMGVLWRFAGNSHSRALDLTGLVSVCHERLAGGSDPLQFESESDLAVEAYLKNRVSFPVRCPPRQDAGFAVRGGGVCTLGDAPAAYVHGLVEAEKVSVFILPRERLAEFGLDGDALQHLRIVHQRVGEFEVVFAAVDQNIVAVVGQQSPARLERVMRAYGTYPETHAHDAA